MVCVFGSRVLSRMPRKQPIRVRHTAVQACQDKPRERERRRNPRRQQLPRQPVHQFNECQQQTVRCQFPDTRPAHRRRQNNLRNGPHSQPPPRHLPHIRPLLLQRRNPLISPKKHILLSPDIQVQTSSILIEPARTNWPAPFLLSLKQTNQSCRRFIIKSSFMSCVRLIGGIIN